MNTTNPVPDTAHFRPPGETKWYAPARDITVLLPALIRRALIEWEDEGSPYHWILGNTHCYYRDEDIGRLAEAMADFVSSDCVVGSTSVEDAFVRSGLDDIPIFLRMVFFSMVAEEMFGAFWWGIRSVTRQDAEKIDCYDEEEFAKLSARLARYMRMPPWKRKIVKLWDRIKARIVKKLGGAHVEDTGQLPGAGCGDERSG